MISEVDLQVSISEQYPLVVSNEVHSFFFQG